jgi:hypothetical protein
VTTDNPSHVSACRGRALCHRGRQAGIGTLTAFFNARTHADHHMTYDVHS